MLLGIQQQLAESQFWRADVMRARQFEQIGELIKHIDRFVPYYGVSLRRAGVRPGEPITDEAWLRVPVLTRAQLQQHASRLAATETPQSHGEIGEYRTSGTSGIPVRILQTKLQHLYWQSFQLREELWHGRALTGSAIGIRRDEQRTDFSVKVHLRRLPDWGAPVSTVYPTGPAAMLDYRSSIPDQVEVLLTERPDYLTTYPSLLLEILRHCRVAGLTLPGLKAVRTVREVVTPELRILCREILGVEITDVYSCGEAGSLAFQCPEHGAYHLQQECALIEILNEDGQPCPTGAIGRVVVTPLHNFAMPLIRYDFGDLAEVGEPCLCGRTLPVVSRFVGRARDTLTLPDGSKRYPYYGHNAMMTVEAIRQHQVVQKSLDEIEIRLVLTRALTVGEEAHIRAVAIEGLGHPFAIRLTRVDEIGRSTSGKYAEFSSELAD